jgi:hypothetical protein
VEPVNGGVAAKDQLGSINGAALTMDLEQTMTIWELPLAAAGMVCSLFTRSLAEEALRLASLTSQ